MFMIFYALIGIPVNGFLFAYLGDFFGKTVCRYNLCVSIKYSDWSFWWCFYIYAYIVHRHLSALQNVQNGHHQELHANAILADWSNRHVPDAGHDILHISAVVPVLVL